MQFQNTLLIIIKESFCNDRLLKKHVFLKLFSLLSPLECWFLLGFIKFIRFCKINIGNVIFKNTLVRIEVQKYEKVQLQIIYLPEVG